MVMRVRWIKESVSMSNTDLPVMSVKEVYKEYTSKDFGYEFELVGENSDKDLIG